MKYYKIIHRIIMSYFTATLAMPGNTLCLLILCSITVFVLSLCNASNRTHIRFAFALCLVQISATTTTTRQLQQIEHTSPIKSNYQASRSWLCVRTRSGNWSKHCVPELIISSWKGAQQSRWISERGRQKEEAGEAEGEPGQRRGCVTAGGPIPLNAASR